MNGTQWVYELVNKFSSPFDEIVKDLERGDNAVQKTETSLSSIGETIIGTAAGFGLFEVASEIFHGITETIGETMEKIVEARGEQQKFTSVLANSFQDVEAGKAAFEMLDEFIGAPLVGMEKLTESFTRMRAKGFSPTEEELVNIGDLAYAMHIPFEQSANIVTDALTGNYRSLKQLGVTAKEEGDKVMFTFRGQTTAVNNNASAIKDYMIGLGELGGIQGAMAAELDNIPGKLLVIHEQEQKLHRQMGDLFGGAIDSWFDFKSAAIEGMIELVGWIDEHSAEIKEFFSAVGFAALFGAAGFLAMNFQAITLFGAMMIGQGVIALTALAQWDLNAALTANPVGAVVMALAAMGVVVYELWQHSETFRATLYGLWETSKVVVGKMFDLFKGLGEVILGVLTGDIDMMKAGIGDISRIQSIGEEMGAAYAKGQEKGIASFKQDEAERAKSKGKKEKSVFDFANQSVITSDAATNKSSNNRNSGGGGGSGRTINVVIQSLIKEVVINTNSVRESAQDVRKHLSETSIAAMRDLEVSLSNG